LSKLGALKSKHYDLSRQNRPAKPGARLGFARACFINGGSSPAGFPQGLKLLDLEDYFDTTEVVPCYKAIYETHCRNSSQRQFNWMEAKHDDRTQAIL
jgi:hypothetical protein